MDEEVFNMQLRRFLKKVGIQSQREIEQAVRQGIETGALTSTEKLNAQVLLRVPAAGVDVTIEDEIALRRYFINCSGTRCGATATTHDGD